MSSPEPNNFNHFLIPSNLYEDLNTLEISFNYKDFTLKNYELKENLTINQNLIYDCVLLVQLCKKYYNKHKRAFSPVFKLLKGDVLCPANMELIPENTEVILTWDNENNILLVKKDNLLEYIYQFNLEETGKEQDKKLLEIEFINNFKWYKQILRARKARDNLYIETIEGLDILTNIMENYTRDINFNIDKKINEISRQRWEEKKEKGEFIVVEKPIKQEKEKLLNL